MRTSSQPAFADYTASADDRCDISALPIEGQLTVHEFLESFLPVADHFESVSYRLARDPNDPLERPAQVQNRLDRPSNGKRTKEQRHRDGRVPGRRRHLVQLRFPYAALPLLHAAAAKPRGLGGRFRQSPAERGRDVPVAAGQR